MASRREELNAYTFSRRRTVAAFLRPSSGGDDEEAPRALRAFVPSLVVGAVAVAAFGAYGILKPSAPKNWQSANAIIVGKQSTARYVVLTDPKTGQRVLHPVLNLASAKLLLDANSTVEEVNDGVLNSAAVLHGAPVGIQYAPDWLPDAADAGTAKTWAACDQGGTDPKSSVTQSLLVLNGADAQRLGPKQELGSDEAVLVQTPDARQYVVDASGTYHQLSVPVGEKAQSLAFDMFPSTYFAPEQVDQSWLQTLSEGQPIDFPTADLRGFGTSAGYALDGQDYTVGTVVQVSSAGASEKYVVTKDGVQHVSDFTAALLEARTGKAVQPVSVNAVQSNGGADPRYFEGSKGWPQEPLKEVNAVSHENRTEVCSTYTTDATGAPKLGVWAGHGNPFSDSSASSSVYVTPGTGLLYRETVGTATNSGKIYLLTQNGMKYPIQVNADAAGSSASAAPTATASPTAAGSAQDNSNLARLGYGQVRPVSVPVTLSSLLPTGPTLDTADAESPQHS